MENVIYESRKSTANGEIELVVFRTKDGSVVLKETYTPDDETNNDVETSAFTLSAVDWANMIVAAVYGNK